VKSGQILIIVLLVVVVALAVGLSVASRNITNLRTSTQTEHSQRAFSAAEGGVEDVLSRLNQFSADIAAGNSSDPDCTIVGGAGGTADCDITVGNITSDVTIAGEPFYESTVELGQVRQEDLNDAVASVAPGDKLTIFWAKTENEEERTCAASIEYILVYKDSTPGIPYTQERGAIEGGCAPVNTEFGFSPPVVSTCTSDPEFADYEKCTEIPISCSGSCVNPEILRVKPFWNKATMRISSSDTSNYPDQVFRVESEAQTDFGVTRRIEVVRTKEPQLPTAFDYVLYSEQDIVK